MKRYTSSERRRIVSDWRSSGQSKKAFCADVGISVTTLYQWISEDKTNIDGFVQLELSPRAELVVTMPCGTTLELSSHDKDTLASILLAIDRCHAQS